MIQSRMLLLLTVVSAGDDDIIIVSVPDYVRATISHEPGWWRTPLTIY